MPTSERNRTTRKGACSLLAVIAALHVAAAQAQITGERFSALDVFELEWAEDPQIAPNGEHIVYRRAGFDIQKDRRRGNLWLLDAVSGKQRKLTDFEGSESAARWSPDGQRIAFSRVSADDDGREIYVYWLESGNSARVTRLPEAPRHIRWSHDGKQLAFEMTVPVDAPIFGKRPPKPDGAKWADEPRITDRLYHERDGSGYLEAGFSQVFVVPAEGGTARQLSSGDFHHRTPEWSPDGGSLVVSGNRSEDWEYDYRNTEVYRIDLDGNIAALTTASGPDHHPLPSPDGRHLAWLGFNDKRQAYQLTRLRISTDNGAQRELLGNLDRSVSGLAWAADSSGLYFQYDDRGRTRIGFVSTSGSYRKLADDLGGTSIGRPYSGGSFSVSGDGRIAYTYTRPEHPADVAIAADGASTRLTALNADLLGHRALGETRELWWDSSVDGRPVQGWLVLPPEFDPTQRYPLLVENHGGPISNYGERFSPEMQLYAAAGYVVLYPNARGSTSYGEEFANLLYHNYPGEDYNDTMDGVDAALAEGFIDEDQLYVTGGSAGGIMTAWIIGKTQRFRAAAVIKPVMNWYSKTLTADNWFRYYETRIPGVPWTNPDDYLRFSPISLVGAVETPTLVMVGLDDLRTPPSEAKQLYHALKFRRIPTALVELPGASHFIARRPSQLIDKIGNILAWFEHYGGDDGDDGK
ncbi:MAG: S9 family peptidase [Pseudomonadota bacterium]